MNSIEKISQFINLEKDTSPKCVYLYIDKADYIHKSMVLLYCHTKDKIHVRVMLPKYVAKLLNPDLCKELENDYILYFNVNMSNNENIIEIRKTSTFKFSKLYFPNKYVKVKLCIGDETIADIYELPFVRNTTIRKQNVRNKNNFLSAAKNEQERLEMESRELNGLESTYL